MWKVFATSLGMLFISMFVTGCVMTTEKFESKRPREAVDAAYSYVAGLIVQKCPANYRIKPSLAAEQRRYKGLILSQGRQEGRGKLSKSLDDMKNAVFDTQCRNMGSIVAQAYGTSRYLEAVK